MLYAICQPHSPLPPFLWADSGAGKRASEASDTSYLRYLFAIILCLAAFLMLSILLHLFIPVTPLHARVTAVGMLLILASPLAIPAHSCWNERRGADVTQQSGGLETQLLKAKCTGKEEKEKEREREREREREEEEEGEGGAEVFPELSGWESLREVNFWLLALSMMCGVSSGYTATNNLAQIGAAQGTADVALPVALVSIWNFGGRVGGGVLSEWALR